MITPVAQKKKRNIWWYLGSAAITLVSLAVVVRLVVNNLDTLLEARNNLRIWPLLLTIPIFALGELLASTVWAKIMNDLTTPLPMIRHQMIFVVTHAARRIPGTVWHVIGRVAWYERLGISKAVSVLANVLETVLMIWSGLILSALLLPFISQARQFALWQFLVGIVLSGLVLHPKVLYLILSRFGQGEQAKNLHYSRVLGWLAYYLFIWLIGGSVLYLLINTIYPLPLTILPVCVGAWAITGVAATIVLVLPSGLGLSEATLGLLLSTQVPSSIAVTAAILMRVLLTILEFLFAAIMFSFREKIGLDAPEPASAPKTDV